MKKFIAFVFAAFLAVVSFADTETVDGVTYTYSIANGEATIGTGNVWVAAISTSTSGELIIPSTLGGCPVTTIGNYAFGNCCSLTSVLIPSSVTNVSDKAFFKKNIVEEFINVGGTLVEVQNCTISNVSTIASIRVDENNPCFSSFDGLLYTKDYSRLLVCPFGKSGDVVFAEGLQELEDCVLGAAVDVTSVLIPSSVTNVSDKAFFKKNIVEEFINVGGTLVEVQNCTISNNNSVASIRVDEKNLHFSSFDGLLYTKDYARLLLCPSAKTGDVVLAEGLRELEKCALGAAVGVTSVSIPSLVTNISDRAFFTKTFIEEHINVGGTLVSVQNCTFSNANSIASIQVDEMNPYFSAFDGLLYTKDFSQLVAFPSGKSGDIVLVEGLRELNDGAIDSSSQISTVLIPSTVTNISVKAFSSRVFTEINVGGQEVSAADFVDCGLIERFVVAPDNAEFAARDGLVYTKDFSRLVKCPSSQRGEIIIPNGVTTIGDGAFSNCDSLKSVVIPGSVMAIGEDAFAGCLNLESLTFLGDCPLSDANGLSLSALATFFIMPDSQGWVVDASGKWNGHKICFLTAEQEFIARAVSVCSLEDLKTFNAFLRSSDFNFSDKELRDSMYAMVDCISIDDSYVNGDWVHYLGEILALPRMRGVLSEQDSEEILKRVLPVVLICTERDLEEHRFSLDNRLYEYSELVSLLGGSMSEEWRVSVMKASLDSLEKYEGKSMGLFAGSQLFRVLSPKLSDDERMAVLNRVIAIAATYDDTAESYGGLEDWAKALFDTASLDAKKFVVGVLKEKSKTSRSSVFLSVAIRLCMDWFGSIEACDIKLEDCVEEIEGFDLLDVGLMDNFSEAIRVYDDGIKRDAIMRIANRVFLSIETDGIIRGFACLTKDCELPVDVKNWLVVGFAQAIINSGPRWRVVSEYVELINAVGEMPANIKNWILKSFTSMAKDEVGSYYTLCDLSEIINAIGDIPSDLRQEIVELCVDVSLRDDITDDAIYGIAEIIDTIGEPDASNCQVLVLGCSSFIDKGLVSYARLYTTLCRWIPEEELEKDVLTFLERISKQENARDLLYGIIDITTVVGSSLTSAGKERILQKLQELVENCDDPLQGVYVYCEVNRTFYDDVRTSSVLPVIDCVIAELNVNRLGEYPITSLWSIFQLIDVESYGAKQRQKLVESVLRLMSQNKNRPDRYYGIKELCVLLKVELSNEEISVIEENSYLSMLSALMSEPSWNAVCGGGYVLSECQKDQSGFSGILCRLVTDMKSSAQNAFLIQSVFEVLEYRAWGFDRELSESAMREIVSGFKDNELAIRDIDEMVGLLSGDARISDDYLNVCGEPFLKVVDDAWAWANGFEGFVNQYGYDLAGAMLKATGKRFDDGRELSVWHDYVAGTDPLDKESNLTSLIEVVNGIPTVFWNPDLGGARAYTILGSTDLKTWKKVEEGHASDYNFFKVTVEMK